MNIAVCYVCTPSSITSRLAVRHRRETLMPRRRRGDLSAVEQFCCCVYSIIYVPLIVRIYDDNGAKDSATASPVITRKYLHIVVLLLLLLLLFRYYISYILSTVGGRGDHQTDVAHYVCIIIALRNVPCAYHI